jgi:hypothetical protein
MALYWHPTGPHMEWTEGMLRISDLNPETKIAWTMTRGQMFVLGLRCVFASLVGLRSAKPPASPQGVKP